MSISLEYGDINKEYSLEYFFGMYNNIYDRLCLCVYLMNTKFLRLKDKYIKKIDFISEFKNLSGLDIEGYNGSLEILDIKKIETLILRQPYNSELNIINNRTLNLLYLNSVFDKYESIENVIVNILFIERDYNNFDKNNLKRFNYNSLYMIINNRITKIETNELFKEIENIKNHCEIIREDIYNINYKLEWNMNYIKFNNNLRKKGLILVNDRYEMDILDDGLKEWFYNNLYDDDMIEDNEIKFSNIVNKLKNWRFEKVNNKLDLLIRKLENNNILKTAHMKYLNIMIKKVDTGEIDNNLLKDKIMSIKRSKIFYEDMCIISVYLNKRNRIPRLFKKYEDVELILSENEKKIYNEIIYRIEKIRSNVEIRK